MRVPLPVRSIFLSGLQALMTSKSPFTVTVKFLRSPTSSRVNITGLHLASAEAADGAKFFGGPFGASAGGGVNGAGGGRGVSCWAKLGETANMAIKAAAISVVFISFLLNDQGAAAFALALHLSLEMDSLRESGAIRQLIR